MSGALASLAALAFALCGLSLMLSLKPWAARLGAVGVILAAGAALAARAGVGA